jgi:hypothetical protein
VEKLEDREAAKDTLRDDAAESGEAKPLHPGTFIVTLQEKSKNDDEESQAGGDETMRMLERNTPNHRGIQGAVGERPVRHGESGVL